MTLVRSLSRLNEKSGLTDYCGVIASAKSQSQLLDLVFSVLAAAVRVPLPSRILA